LPGFGPMFTGPGTAGPIIRGLGTLVPETIVEVFGSTSDGVIKCGWDPDWSDVWNGLVSIITTDDDGGHGQAMYVYAGPGFNYISRSFLFFDLSSPPDIGAPKRVTLVIYGATNHDSSVSVQEGTQHDPLIDADFTAWTGPQFALHPWAVPLNEIKFNPDGIAYIASKIGSTAKLCLRECTRDYFNNPPGETVDLENGMHYQDQIEGYRPYLKITY